MTAQRITDRGYHPRMDKPRYVLRNLPGIQDVEAMAKRVHTHRNPSWAPEREALERLAERLSHTLFGIGPDDWHAYDDEAPKGATPEERAAWGRRWYEHFGFLDQYPVTDEENEEVDRAAHIIWEAMGWDVTDGNGEFLSCLRYFDRQIVCATKGLRGRLPDAAASEAADMEAAEAWGERLLKDWRKSPRHRGSAATT